MINHGSPLGSMECPVQCHGARFLRVWTAILVIFRREHGFDHQASACHLVRDDEHVFLDRANFLSRVET